MSLLDTVFNSLSLPGHWVVILKGPSSFRITVANNMFSSSHCYDRFNAMLLPFLVGLKTYSAIQRNGGDTMVEVCRNGSKTNICAIMNVNGLHVSVPPVLIKFELYALCLDAERFLDAINWYYRENFETLTLEGAGGNYAQQNVDGDDDGDNDDDSYDDDDNSYDDDDDSYDDNDSYDGDTLFQVPTSEQMVDFPGMNQLNYPSAVYHFCVPSVVPPHLYTVVTDTSKRQSYKSTEKNSAVCFDDDVNITSSKSESLHHLSTPSLTHAPGYYIEGDIFAPFAASSPHHTLGSFPCCFDKPLFIPFQSQFGSTFDH